MTAPDTNTPRDLTDDEIDAIQREWLAQRGSGPRGFARAIEGRVRAADREARPAPAMVEAVAWQVRTPGGEWRTVRGKLSDEYVANMGYEVRELGVIDRLAAASTPPAEAQPVATFTEGHCEEKRKPGGCQLHNLHCGYPKCDRRTAPPASEARATGDAAGMAAWKPGEWFQAASVDDMQAFFRARLPAIRDAAREHGYAIGVHGSERRDFDLMAMPWRDGASDAETLARAVAVAACGLTRSGPYDWEKKPLGRIATSIPVCWTPPRDVPSDGHIDLSVMPAVAATGAAGEPQPREGLLAIYCRQHGRTHHCDCAECRRFIDARIEYATTQVEPFARNDLKEVVRGALDLLNGRAFGKRARPQTIARRWTEWEARAEAALSGAAGGQGDKP